MSNAPRVIIEVGAPGAAQAAAGLRDVASAQGSIGTAQEATAKAAANLASKFNLNADALEKARGAYAPFNAALVGLKGALAGGLDAVAGFTLAVGGIPGPLGLVGQAAATVVTAYQILTSNTDAATAALGKQRKTLPPLWAELDRIKKTILDTVNAQAAFERAAAGIGRDGPRLDPRRRQELLQMRDEEKKAADAVRVATQALDAAQQRELETKQRAAKVAAMFGETSKSVGSVVSVQSGNIQRLQADLDFARAKLDSLRFAQEATAAVVTKAGKAEDNYAESLAKSQAALDKRKAAAQAKAAADAAAAQAAAAADLAQRTAVLADVDAIDAESLAREEALEQARFALVASGVEARLARRRDEAAESQRLAEETARAQVEAQTKLTEAMTGAGAAYAKAALSAVLYGGSVKEAINATARAAFIEGTVGALGALAKAAVFSVINPPAVAPMLSAAAIYGAQAAIAGGIAAATGGLTGGGGKQQAADLSAPQDFGREEPREAQDTTMTVNLFGEGTQRRPLDRASAAAIIGALADLVGSGGRMELRRA